VIPDPGIIWNDPTMHDTSTGCHSVLQYLNAFKALDHEYKVDTRGAMKRSRKPIVDVAEAAVMPLEETITITFGEFRNVQNCSFDQFGQKKNMVRLMHIIL
jgi:hypothetical protein